MKGAHRGYQKYLTLGNKLPYMSHIIRDAWAVPDSSYQTKNNVLTDDSCHGGTEPSIVMAEQSPQDVVKQEQSVDDLSSTDVSATHTTDSAARAALESLSATSTVQTYHTPSSSEPPGRLDNHDESQFISKQADIEGSASAVTVGPLSTVTQIWLTFRRILLW